MMSSVANSLRFLPLQHRETARYMAADKEAGCLSRVHMYTNVSVPCNYEIIVYSVLKHNY